MKHLIGMLAAATLVFSVASAEAQPLAQQNPPANFDMGLNSGDLLSNFTIPTSSVIDTYNFTVNNQADTGTFNLGVDLWRVPLTNFLFSLVQLVDQTTSSLLSPSFSGNSGRVSLVFSGLDLAHKYELTVQGSGTAGSAGYFGDLNARATPLPPSFGLFLSALVGLGFLMFRRRRATLPA